MYQPLEPVLRESENFIREYFQKNMPAQYSFHNFDHTAQVVHSAYLIGEREGLSTQDMHLLKIAAWFHDTGYTEGGMGHEARSVLVAENFLKGKLSEEHIMVIKDIIMATKMPQSPKTLNERIICDADLAHLGNEHFWERNDLLKAEMEANGIKMNKNEWLQFEINFIANHHYHTDSGRYLFENNKQLFLKQLYYELNKRKEKNSTEQPNPAENFDFEQKKLSRGSDTLFRTSYNHHLNLNTLADSKAHIMMGVNSIIFSVVGSNLIPKWQTDYRLIIPTIFLLGACLLSVFYAILTIKPKLIKGNVSLDEVKEKTADLLFFGNYTGMKLPDYQWAMRQLIQDQQYIYDSMSKSIYFLGQVLNKKYRYLTYCYNVFLYGLLISVVLFSVCLLLIPK